MLSRIAFNYGLQYDIILMLLQFFLFFWVLQCYDDLEIYVMLSTGGIWSW